MELMTTGSKLFSAPCNQLGSSNRGLHRHKPAKLHTSPGSHAHGCLPPCRGARRCAACPASAATQCGLWGHPAPDHSAAPPAAAAAGPACHAGPTQAGALQQDTAETGQQGSCSALLHACMIIMARAMCFAGCAPANVWSRFPHSFAAALQQLFRHLCPCLSGQLEVAL